MMNASNNNGSRPNESSAEDDLEDENEDDKKLNGSEGSESKTLLVTLLKQINLLHETNSKIFRNLHETKGKWAHIVAHIRFYFTKTSVSLAIIDSKLFFFCNFFVVEMEALKYAPSWNLRHRRDSVSGLSVHSQPFGYGGMASPAPTYHSQGKQSNLARSEGRTASNEF
jgi:hypothetical protein